LETVKIAYCFISRSDWAVWCQVNPDIPDDANYETWLKNVEDFCGGILADGGRPIQIDVKPAEFLAWCNRAGRDVNSSARAGYAAARLNEINKNRGGK
jgi:hypothetical protein